MKINILNIGCFKNLVDSEHLMKALSCAGNTVSLGELKEKVDLAIINTCGFINDADNASLDTIKRYAGYKRDGLCQSLWVMGCYVQKVGENLRQIMPDVDRVYGNFDWQRIPLDLGLNCSVGMERVITTPSHYAFVKISEGCNQSCSYCIKPVLNGPLKSVSQEDLLEECRWLVKNGVKEIQLVAQNLTSYGTDLDGRKKISELVERIADIPGIAWIRLHYAYPAGFPKDLLRVIRERPNVCKYLDMAIQHCNTKMLKLMRRGMNKEKLSELIDFIRSEVPGITLRTTVMTGYPGETEDIFFELCDFIKKQKFERLGVFAYSNQEGTYANTHYVDNISESIKRARALSIMNIQNEIYKELNGKLVGKTVNAIVDGNFNGTYYARPESSTPMADPKIHLNIDGCTLIPGQFYNIKITEVLGKDLKGVTI